MIVIGNNGPPLQGHTMNIKQFAQASGIFGGNHIRPPKKVERAQGYIAGRPDGGGHKIKPRAQFRRRLIHHWTRPT